MPEYEQFKLDANVWGSQHEKAVDDIKSRYPGAKVSSKPTPDVPGGDRALVIDFSETPDELKRQDTARKISDILEDNRAYVSNVVVKGSGGSEIKDDRLSGLLADVSRYHREKDEDKKSKNAEYQGLLQLSKRTSRSGRGRVNR